MAASTADRVRLRTCLAMVSARTVDRRSAAAPRGDDGGVAGPGELDAFKADRADRGRAVLQVDDGLAALRQDIERGAAHADGRQRRRDLVGGLVRMAGDETKRARGHAHRDITIVMLVVENGAVELERRVGSEREVGAVGHHQARCTVDPGAHGFVTDQSIADINLGGRRSGNAEYFILDDGRFADPRLRIRGSSQRSYQASSYQASGYQADCK